MLIVCYAECFHSFSSSESKNICLIIFFPFSLAKDPNNFLTQSSSVTAPSSKESEVQQRPTEKPCSPRKTEEHTQTAKSALPQPVQSKAEPVKKTHVQLEPKGKPTTPGRLLFGFSKYSFKLGLCVLC